ncbi:Niemann-Pick C2 protein [Clonorchis sinensis]|uniref:Niemann-Pick C2 protein n=1 Tax=Clonorchis sinensis TaxID=79923 RepID=G7Y9E5_CLOSI|nr:Niemann-Pick C2 protein [Clonorchis sinensis]
MLYLAISLITLLQLTEGHRIVRTVFKDCGSVLGRIKRVEVNPCDTRPCTLYKNEMTQITLGFVTEMPIDNGTAVVHGIVEYIPIYFPLDNPGLCEFTKPTCPLEPSVSEFTYSVHIPVLPTYPSLVSRSSSHFDVCLEPERKRFRASADDDVTVEEGLN